MDSNFEDSNLKEANIEILDDLDATAGRCVDIFISTAEEAIKSDNRFCVAVSGGRTPNKFFSLLGHSPQAKSLDWNCIHLFWVDERMVDINSSDNNYKMASDTFLAKVSIPLTNIHRIPTEYTDLKAAVDDYQNQMQEVFDLSNGEIPEFDLIFLGMGVDGHTASLFPDNCACFDTGDLACVVYFLGDTLDRITLTAPVLKASKKIIVLINGNDKAEIIKTVLSTSADEIKYPIHAIWPILDRVTWLIDQDAAKLL